jgi:molybdopterin-containing oxidoreductase family membrane subunit
MKKFANFDAGEEAVKKLTTIIMYAVIINTFFFLLEFFVGYYSEVPGHMHSLEYLFFGLEHHGEVYNNLVPFMWTATLFNFAGLGILAYMKISKIFDFRLVTVASVLIFLALWADKGLGFVFAGFVPNPLEEVTEYIPTMNELGITIGIWATGFFLLTLLYKIALGVEHEVEQ